MSEASAIVECKVCTRPCVAGNMRAFNLGTPGSCCAECFDVLGVAAAKISLKRTNQYRAAKREQMEAAVAPAVREAMRRVERNGLSVEIAARLATDQHGGDLRTVIRLIKRNRKRELRAREGKAA